MKARHAAPLLLSLAASSALAYDVSGFKWPNGEMQLYVGIPSTLPNGETWNDVIASAAASWDNPVDGLKIEIIDETRDPCAGYSGTGATTTLSFVPPPASGSPARDNTVPAENGIGISADVCGDNFGTDVVAVTLTQGTPPEFREADIIFNSAFQFDRYTGAYNSQVDTIDLFRTAIHQIGFAIGLDEEANIPSIMHPNAPFRSLTLPTTDDIAGAKVIYPVQPPSNEPPIRVGLEEPGNNQVKSGISNIRGWVVGLEDIRLVEMRLDGGTYQRVPYGSTRGDVANAFSQYPKSGSSGFSMVYNWGNLSTGSHTMDLRAYDIEDRVSTVSRTFTVARFNDSYVSKVDITASNSSIGADQKTLTLTDVNANDEDYTVQIQWDNAAQKFIIVNVQ